MAAKPWRPASWPPTSWRPHCGRQLAMRTGVAQCRLHAVLEAQVALASCLPAGSGIVGTTAAAACPRGGAPCTQAARPPLTCHNCLASSLPHLTCRLRLAWLSSCCAFERNTLACAVLPLHSNSAVACACCGLSVWLSSLARVAPTGCHVGTCRRPWRAVQHAASPPAAAKPAGKAEAEPGARHNV